MPWRANSPCGGVAGKAGGLSGGLFGRVYAIELAHGEHLVIVLVAVPEPLVGNLRQRAKEVALCQELGSVLVSVPHEAELPVEDE